MQSQLFSISLPHGGRSIFLPAKKGSVYGIFSFTRPHIFHLLTEEGVAAMFLRTVAADTEQARAFVSKNSEVDLDALRSILTCCTTPIISLKKASCGLKSGIKTKSILLDGQNCILHLYMIEEPDQFGQWKVCEVVKECR